MITPSDIAALCRRQIAFLRWEFWRYSFARTLLLSGADVTGQRLCVLIELAEYLDLPVRMAHPIFSMATPEDIDTLCQYLPHAREEYDRHPCAFLKVRVNGTGYYLWAHKLTVIDESDYPDLTQYIDEEIAQLKQTHLPI